MSVVLPPSQNFAQYEPFTIFGEPYIYVLQSKTNPSSRLQFYNETLPERYIPGGQAEWAKVIINFGFCDWVTSFGALNNNLPSDTQINNYIRSVFTPGPGQMEGIQAVLPSSASGTSLVDTVDSTSTVAYIRNAVSNDSSMTIANVGNGQVNLQVANNPSLIKYQTTDTVTPGTKIISVIGNADESALVTVSGTSGTGVIQLLSNQIDMTVTGGAGTYAVTSSGNLSFLSSAGSATLTSSASTAGLQGNQCNIISSGGTTQITTAADFNVLFSGGTKHFVCNMEAGGGAEADYLVYDPNLNLIKHVAKPGQNISLTSDVTGSGVNNGSITTTIANNAVTTSKINNSAVTYSKLQSETASTLLGNPTGLGAVPSEITLGSGLSFAGQVLNQNNPSTIKYQTTDTVTAGDNIISVIGNTDESALVTVSGNSAANQIQAISKQVTLTSGTASLDLAAGTGTTTFGIGAGGLVVNGLASAATGFHLFYDPVTGQITYN